MQTTSQKNSFGNGYGLNRNVGGKSALPAAVPPYGRITVNPGPGKQMPGSPKMEKYKK